MTRQQRMIAQTIIAVTVDGFDKQYSPTALLQGALEHNETHGIPGRLSPIGARFGRLSPGSLVLDLLPECHRDCLNGGRHGLHVTAIGLAMEG